MTTVLEGVKARYEAVMSDDLTGPKPKALRRILRTDIPLLLAVAGAAAELQLAEAELNSGSSDIADWTPFEHVRAHKRYRRARAALEEVITLLLEDEE